MATNKSNMININSVSDNIKRFTDATSQMFINNINNNLQWFNDIQQMLGLSGLPTNQSNCNACPPDCDCPSQCLLNITRDANAGESIIVAFKVKNTLQTPKVYQVGVRPFYDDNGNTLNNQPAVNKTSINLQPGQSILLQLSLFLGEEYAAGNSYSTEIVIREKDVNQNICFTLNVNSNNYIPEAYPLNEQQYFSHFQDWKSHYYCDSRPTIHRVVPVNQNDTIKK